MNGPGQGSPYGGGGASSLNAATNPWAQSNATAAGGGYQGSPHTGGAVRPPQPYGGPHATGGAMQPQYGMQGGGGGSQSFAHLFPQLSGGAMQPPPQNYGPPSFAQLFGGGPSNEPGGNSNFGGGPNYGYNPSGGNMQTGAINFAKQNYSGPMGMAGGSMMSPAIAAAKGGPIADPAGPSSDMNSGMGGGNAFLNDQRPQYQPQYSGPMGMIGGNMFGYGGGYGGGQGQYKGPNPTAPGSTFYGAGGQNGQLPLGMLNNMGGVYK